MDKLNSDEDWAKLIAWLQANRRILVVRRTGIEVRPK